MRLCLYCGHVFLVFVLTNAEKGTKDADSEEEETPQKDSVFSDVIKNITRVNNVLQDLIQNYEKLQKIYKSQETLEEYSDKSREGIERFRGGKKKAKKPKDKTSTLSTTKNPNFPATQIFGSASAESSEKIKAKNKEMKKLKENAEKMKEKEKTTTDNEIVSEASSEEESKETNESSSPKDKNVVVKGKLSIKEPKEPKSSIKVKGIEPKLNIKTSEAVTNVADHPNPGITNQTLKKQVIQTETFSKKDIWNDIMNNRPVVLKKEEEIIYSKRKNDDSYGRHKKKVSVRQKEVKTAINNTTLIKNQTEKNKKGNKKAIYRTQKSKNATITSQSAEDERTIQKEQFKTLILRKAYGDACLKVVVKKCYKACKGVLKRGCRLYSCKDDFSKMFKETSKTGCIREFRELEIEAKVPETTADGKKFKVTDVATRASPLAMDNCNLCCRYPPIELGRFGYLVLRKKDDFLDLTRNGYLAAACLPKSGSSKASAPNKGKKANRRSATGSTPSSVDHELNILRDRFERACQKSSSDKCVKACNFAVEETCATHDCSGDKKEEMKKACKKECKSAYSYESSKKSKSSASSASESGSSGSSSESEEKETTKRKVKIVTQTTPTTPKRFIKISKNTRSRPVTPEKLIQSSEKKAADEKTVKHDVNTKSKPKRSKAVKVDKKVVTDNKPKVQKKVKTKEKERVVKEKVKETKEKEKETKEKETEEKSATEESEEEEE